jgi:hypothetical protein
MVDMMMIDWHWRWFIEDVRFYLLLSIKHDHWHDWYIDKHDDMIDIEDVSRNGFKQAVDMVDMIGMVTAQHKNHVHL